MSPPKPWQEIAREAQYYRDSTIAKLEPPLPTLPGDLPLDVSGVPRRYLSENEIKLTETAPETLLAQLANGEITCLAVTKAFLRRAGLAQQLANCVTELLPDRAISRAKYADKYLADHCKPIGPLHGLPISVKEHIQMDGLGLNLGYVSHYGETAPEGADAHILQILHDAGAIFYVRTTEPQTIMHLECSSNLYGVTVNPFNRNLSSGGSSGGEGALIGLRGSCLGIGSDIGGRSSANCSYPDFDVA